MQNWLSNSSSITNSIEKLSSSTVIHKSRATTLAFRVKTVMEAIASLGPSSINMNDAATQGYFSMLSATFEEICHYFKILQTIDKTLAKRVQSFGSDEEMFSKWSETLQACSGGLHLSVADSIFDADRDLADFNRDFEHLKLNLFDIIQKVLDVENSKKLLAQQQVDRTAYKTQQAVKSENKFDAKLIRYEAIIGAGGNLLN